MFTPSRAWKNRLVPCALVPERTEGVPMMSKYQWIIHACYMIGVRLCFFKTKDEFQACGWAVPWHRAQELKPAVDEYSATTLYKNGWVGTNEALCNSSFWCLRSTFTTDFRNQESVWISHHYSKETPRRFPIQPCADLGRPHIFVQLSCAIDPSVNVQIRPQRFSNKSLAKSWT